MPHNEQHDLSNQKTAGAWVQLRSRSKTLVSLLDAQFLATFHSHCIPLIYHRKSFEACDFTESCHHQRALS